MHDMHNMHDLHHMHNMHDMHHTTVTHSRHRLQASIAARDSEVEQWREEATTARRLAEEAAAAAEETAVLADEVLRLEAVLKEKDDALDVRCRRWSILLCDDCCMCLHVYVSMSMCLCVYCHVYLWQEIDSALEEAENLRAEAQKKIKDLKARVERADLARAEADKARQVRLCLGCHGATTWSVVYQNHR